MRTKVLLVLILGIALVVFTNQAWADKARVIHLEDVTEYWGGHGQVTIHPRANVEGLEWLNLNTHNLVGQDDAFYAIYISFLDNPSEKILIHYFNPSPMMIGYSVGWIDVGGIPGLFTRDIVIEIVYEEDDGVYGIDNPQNVVLRGIDLVE